MRFTMPGLKVLQPVLPARRPAEHKTRRLFLLGVLCIGCLALVSCGPAGENPPNGISGAGPSGSHDDRSGGRGGRKAARIVFFGDSITKAGTRPGGYVSLITQALADLYPDRDIDVTAAGVTGDTVGDLQNRLARDVLSRRPTHVVIYIGVNEVGQRRSSSRIAHEDRIRYHNGLLDLITRVRDSGARPFLCTPAVFGDDPDARSNENKLLDQYAEISRRVAADTGTPLCDLRSAFKEFLRVHNPNKRYQGLVTVDGVHLNERGNRLVAEQILKVLDVSDASPAA